MADNVRDLMTSDAYLATKVTAAASLATPVGTGTAITVPSSGFRFLTSHVLWTRLSLPRRYWSIKNFDTANAIYIYMGVNPNSDSDVFDISGGAYDFSLANNSDKNRKLIKVELGDAVIVHPGPYDSTNYSIWVCSATAAVEVQVLPDLNAVS